MLVTSISTYSHNVFFQPKKKIQFYLFCHLQMLSIWSINMAIYHLYFILVLRNKYMDRSPYLGFGRVKAPAYSSHDLTETFQIFPHLLNWEVFLLLQKLFDTAMKDAFMQHFQLSQLSYSEKRSKINPLPHNTF